MSQVLTLKLSDRLFSAINLQAQAIGIPTEDLATRYLEQKLSLTAKSNMTEEQKKLAKSTFESYFGIISADVGSLDNEIIDADLANEYANNSENSCF